MKTLEMLEIYLNSIAKKRAEAKFNKEYPELITPTIFLKQEEFSLDLKKQEVRKAYDKIFNRELQIVIERVCFNGIE